MAQLGQAWVTLSTKDQDLRKGLNNAHSLVTRQVASMQSKLRGLTIGIGSAAMTAGLVAGMRAGIKAVDDFKLSTIGVAATLTDMAKKGSGDLQSIYRNNLAYAQDTYKKVELAAAKFFASGEEMVQAWQILTQKGTVISTDEDINNLGVVVDKIKLMTQGQTSSLQIAQEIRSVMNGQARATDQIAMYLKDRVGPEWENQLNQAREQGKVLEWLSGQFQGLKYASGDIENTLEAQLSTLQTLAKQVGRQGLEGAYSDIVGIVKEINTHIETHRDLLAGGITSSWNTIKGILTDPELNQFVSRTLGEGASQAEDLGAALKGLLGTARELLGLFNSLPDYITGPAGLGIIGAMVFGAKAGTVIGTLAAINNGLNTLGMGVQGFVEKYQGLGGALEKIGDVVTGKRDWNTGAIIGENGVPRIELDIKKKPTPDAPKWSPPQIDAPKAVGGGGGKGPSPVSFNDIDQTIISMEARTVALKEDLRDLALEGEMIMAKGLNKDLLGLEQKYGQEVKGIWQDIAQQQKQFDELAQKLSDSKGGATAEAQAGLQRAQEALNATWAEGIKLLDQMGNNKAMETAQITKSFNLDNAESLAQLRVTYADLTGSIDDQVRAQLAYIAAVRDRNVEDAKTPEIAAMYRMLADEQSRLATIKAGSFFDGFNESFAQYERNLPTISEMGSQVFGSLESSINSAAQSMFSMASAGEMSFERVGRAFLEMVAKMTAQAASSAIAQMLVKIIGTAASSYFGGGSAGTNYGSMSSGFTPTFHASGDYWFNEPTFAVGMRSGKRHVIAEREPEYLVGPRSKMGGSAGHTINTSINVTMPAGGGGNPEADQKRVALLIKAEFNRNLREQMRPGGMLHQGIKVGG